MLVAVTIAAVREQAMETASWRCQIKDLVSSGVGYDRRAGAGRGDGYGSVRRDRYDRRVGSVATTHATSIAPSVQRMQQPSRLNVLTDPSLYLNR